MSIIYPENTADIIQEIVKKYNLSESVNEGAKNILEEDSINGKEEIIKNLPNSKIAKIIIGLADRSITQQSLSKIIEKELNVSSRIAGEIAKTLEEKVVPFIEIKKEDINNNAAKDEFGKVKEKKIPVDQENFETDKDTYRESTE